ncbi:isoleucine--tRNA ligase [Candidatus Saccharibacteria bacterium]|nr:isoleucine--tRNA ligase [Candidatus Saccharibacteria bacterium]
MKKIPQYKPNQVEEEILSIWEKEDTFRASLEKTKNGEPFSFYDGPPFANGLPHFGHSLVQSIKDSIGRYQTMKGRYVERRNGWDCHGLPVEFAIEKEFNVSGKKQIMELGLEKFNQACRDSVFSYKNEWEGYFDRIGRWTDKENSYATIDSEYTESVWWTFKQIHDKGLIYKGFKCMPYCPRCATPLSNFEVNEGYKDDTPDPSVYVKFKLKDEESFMLAWTTTPWSLPGNAALAVKQDAVYLKIALKDELDNEEVLVLAKERLEVLKTDDYKIIEEIKGTDLVGLSYEPIFKVGVEHENLYKVWSADFVSTEDGTGVLHVAPAFGEDDLKLGQDNDIPVINTIDTDGKVKQGFGLDSFEGKFFKSADKLIIEQLTEQNKIFSAETFRHTYPFCYRCDTPLLYYSIDTWFVAVSKIKKQLLSTASEINWNPSHIKTGRFGKWLEGARDWAISRNRYWGAPIPIWVNEKDDSDYIVVESIEELKKLSPNAKDLNDLHRPFIDEVVIEREGKTYRRVEEVIDCWFESGSMPIAQQHFPYDNKTQFDASFPADYIGEGLDQTRLWFYVLHIISTIVFDKPAYKNVLVNGMIMAADGQKLSKRLKNYPPIEDVFENEGADTLRYYLLSSAPAVTADYMNFDRDAMKDINRNLFMTLYNTASFLTMYTEIDDWAPDSMDMPIDVSNPLDNWLLARVNETIDEVTKAADNFELSKATWPIYKLVDDMSNWYVRRSRRRFWKSEDDSDKLEAYKTLHWSLVTTCKLLAPWSPFMSDWLYRNITTDIMSAPKSVHLCDWPEASELNSGILSDMEMVRQYVNDGLSIRAEAKIKVRQPLASAELGGPNDLQKGLKEIIAEELNVKELTYKQDDKLSVELNTEITQSLHNEGIARDIVRNIQSARKEAGLQVENRIKLCLYSESEVLNTAVDEFKNMIIQETLTEQFMRSEKGLDFTKQVSVDGAHLTIELEKK